MSRKGMALRYKQRPELVLYGTEKDFIPEIKVQYFKGNKIGAQKISSSDDVADFIRSIYPKDTIEFQEQFIVLYLDKSNHVKGYHKHTLGGIDSTIADIRIILSVALKTLSTSIILTHNHPSGNLKPSEADKKLTAKIKIAGSSMDISVLDHVIITKEGYYSFADDGLMGIEEGNRNKKADPIKLSPTINIIKEFLKMHGRFVSRKKMLALKKSLKVADKNKSTESAIKLIETKLEVLDKKIGNGAKVFIKEKDLSSLKKSLSNSSFNRSGIGTIYSKRMKGTRMCKSRKFSDAGKGACSHHKGLSGILTAEEIANKEFELLDFKGKWLELIGNPEKNFTMMLHGEPGAGKTTFILMFVQYLSTLGNVLYVSSEEFGSATLASKVKEILSPIPPNIHFTSNIYQLNISKYNFVVLDSINDLGLNIESFKQLKSNNPQTAFILVLQHTKQGQFKGGKEWEHEAQIAGAVSNGVISIYKNRYGVKSDLNFFK